MVEDRPIRGVLFDSGDVLVHPIGGRWNPRYDFESILLSHHPKTPVERFPDASAAGQRLLDADPTPTVLRRLRGCAQARRGSRRLRVSR